MAGRYFRRARHAAPVPHSCTLRGRRRALRCEQLEDRRLLAVLTVDTNLDVVDFNDGLMSLREAVFVANTVEGVDEIRFDFGQDEPATLLLTGGEIAITEGLAIVGLGRDVFTIDAQLNSRIFNVSGEGADLELSGMTLLNGRATGDNLTTSEIVQQKHSGGAVRSVAGATLRIDDLAIRGSSVTGANASGGAIFASGSLIVANSVISGNSASGRNGVGGGIAATGLASIRATTVSGNTASRGGGASVSSTGSLTIDRSTFSDNVAADSFAALGGAVYSAGRTTLTSSTISNNAARVTGFDSVAQGAGIWSSGRMEIAHNTIVANTASSVGAGATASGGGIYANHLAEAFLLVDHTIVAGNFATEGPAEIRVGDHLFEMRYSLLGDNDGTLLAEAPIGWADDYGNLIGGSMYGFVDPLLDGLEDNGGPTRTHALLPGSPAIFAGDPWSVPGDDVPEFDQRGEGYSRRAGTRIDIGAVEYSGRTLIVDSLGDHVDGDYGLGKFTLREALALANELPDYDVIEFADSLYATGTATIQVVGGELRILQETAIYGRNSEQLTISGGGSRSRVIRTDANTLLTGLTVSGGNIPDSGGGILSSEKLTLIGVTVEDHLSVFEGSGVWATALTMIASQVSDNESLMGAGGIHVIGEFNMDRSIVSNNRAPNRRDGVGGIYAPVVLSQPRGPVSISHSIITGNTGGRTGGMTVSIRNFAMQHTVIAENSGVGGGLELQEPRSVHISQSSIVRNTGYGMSLISAILNEAIVEDSTISGNRTQRLAGGIHTIGNLTLRRVTVTDNTAEGVGVSGDGGGIVVAGQLTLENTIVAGNNGPTAPDIWQRPNATIDAKYSIIGDNRGTTLAEVSPDSQSSTNHIGGPVGGVLSPGLGPLMGNGGPRLPTGYALATHLPLPGSRVINRGNYASQPGDGTTPEFDQRGELYRRVLGGRIDIGAVEAPVYSGSATGDFNQDGKVDGADFLAWQRGYGRTDAAVSDGDGLPDGQVDGNDLAVWKQQFGTVALFVKPVAVSGVAVAAAADAVVASMIAGELAPREFVTATIVDEATRWSVPLTPAVEGFARRAGTEGLLTVKHAVFAVEDEVHRTVLDSSWPGVERRATGEEMLVVEEVDCALEEAEGMERLAWGLIGR